MAIVIDTSALVEMERLLEQGAAVPQSLSSESAIVPAIVWAEALIGVRLADSSVRAARRRAHLEAIRLHAEIVPFAPEIAEHYADIHAELARAGTPIPQNDLAVAATGRAFGFAVLVGPKDEQRFAQVDGLDTRVIDASAADTGG